MARVVVAIVGENANGILECQSHRFLDLLRPLDLEGRVLRIGDPNFLPALNQSFQDGTAFAWAYAGVGSRLTLGGRNLWEAAGIPFISVLADAPFIMPPNHHVRSTFVVNGYVYREWLELQERHFRSQQISALLPMGVISNQFRNDTKWAARPTRMLFVKTGQDPAKQRANWYAWPARLRAVLDACAEMLATSDPGPIVPVVQECLRSQSLVLDGCKPILFGLLHELDTYIRALRATAVARALLPLPVDIVGSGWEHVQSMEGRARFHPAIPASELDARYAQTQILVNTTPNFASGAHERVLRGFAARCAVLSDNNVFAQSHLQHLRSYFGFQWHAPGLTDLFASVFHEARCSDADLDQAETFVAKNYDPQRFLERMIELSQLPRLQPIMSGYALDAA